jgi:hypothetical protein
MYDLKLLSLTDLLDLVIQQTSYHIHLIAVGASLEVFRNSGDFLREVQQEIRLRHVAFRENDFATPTFN